jgi:hypothetical protein
MHAWSKFTVHAYVYLAMASMIDRSINWSSGWCVQVVRTYACCQKLASTLSSQIMHEQYWGSSITVQAVTYEHIVLSLWVDLSVASLQEGLTTCELWAIRPTQDLQKCQWMIANIMTILLTSDPFFRPQKCMHATPSPDQTLVYSALFCFSFESLLHAWLARPLNHNTNLCKLMQKKILKQKTFILVWSLDT